jgi:hypothetical protein
MEFFLLTIGSIMGPRVSVSKIGGGVDDYWVAEVCYTCIYATASYSELLLNGV